MLTPTSSYQSNYMCVCVYISSYMNVDRMQKDLRRLGVSMVCNQCVLKGLLMTWCWIHHGTKARNWYCHGYKIQMERFSLKPSIRRCDQATQKPGIWMIKSVCWHEVERRSQGSCDDCGSTAYRGRLQLVRPLIRIMIQNTCKLLVF